MDKSVDSDIAHCNMVVVTDQKLAELAIDLQFSNQIIVGNDLTIPMRGKGTED